MHKEDIHGWGNGDPSGGVCMKGILLTIEALAALWVLIGGLLIVSSMEGARDSRLSELVVLMQAGDVAAFIADSGGMGRVDEDELEEAAKAMGACVRVLVGEVEVFRSDCFGGGGLTYSAEYFEVRDWQYAVATVELEKNK